MVDFEKEIYKNLDTYLKESKFVFSKKSWQKIKGNKLLITNKLKSIFDAKEKLNIKNIIEINEKHHCSKNTKGASVYFSQVSNKQGGEFCVLCGKSYDLEVDHINPVNLGGDPANITNLQLLCKRCNIGKSNFFDYGISSISSREKKHLNELTPSLEFSFRNINIKLINKRTFGLCSCGIDSSKCEISIAKKYPEMCWGPLNLKTNCENCI